MVGEHRFSFVGTMMLTFVADSPDNGNKLSSDTLNSSPSTTTNDVSKASSQSTSGAGSPHHSVFDPYRYSAYSGGIDSPSDSRRPRQAIDTSKEKRLENTPTASEDPLTADGQAAWKKDVDAEQDVIPTKDSYSEVRTILSSNDAGTGNALSDRNVPTAKKKDSVGNSSTGSQAIPLQPPSETLDWRQTALDRRAAAPRYAESSSQGSINVQPVEAIPTSQSDEFPKTPKSLSNVAESLSATPIETQQTSMKPIPYDQYPSKDMSSELDINRQVLRAEVAFPEDVATEHRVARNKPADVQPTAITGVENLQWAVKRFDQDLEKSTGDRVYADTVPYSRKSNVLVASKDRDNVRRGTRPIVTNEVWPWPLQREQVSAWAPQVKNKQEESLETEGRTDYLMTPPQPQTAQSAVDHPKSSSQESGRFSTQVKETTEPARPTSQVLSQLPEDDIDFLTADEIRAAMGKTKRTKVDPEEKEHARKKLEEDYEAIHREGAWLDQAIASGVLNGEHLRRTQRGLLDLKPKHELARPVLETSIDRMIANGGRKKTTESIENILPESRAETAEIPKQQAAIQKKLDEEIQSQKIAMQGLSDDGYSRIPAPAPKPTPKVTPEVLGPLENSLFRPFEQQLSSLGKEVGEVESDIIKANKTVNEAAENKKEQAERDRALVQEVRSAYEDVYGPITIGHRQVQPEVEKDESVEMGGEKSEGSSNPASIDTSTSLGDGFNADYTPSNFASELDSLAASKEATHDATFGSSESAVDDVVDRDSQSQGLNTDYTSSNFTSELESLAASNGASQDAAFRTPESSVDNVVARNSQPHGLRTDFSSSTSSSSTPEAVTSAQSSDPIENFDSLSPETTPESMESQTATPPISYTYKILAHDRSTNQIITATYQPPSTEPLNPTIIPLPTALSKLRNPALFLPRLPQSCEVITAEKHLLIIREEDPSSQTTPSSSSSPQIILDGIAREEESLGKENEEESEGEVVDESGSGRDEVMGVREEEGWRRDAINPIDGTTRPLPEAALGNWTSPT